MFEWCLVIFVGVFIWCAFFWNINYVKGLRNNNGQNAGMPSPRRQVGDIPPVYPNGWFSLLESSQLKKGQVKHIAALGENFAVFRTKQGDANIIDAYCPHLGANMAQGGKVLDDGCLECPFHHWTFNGDGECRSIPYAKNVPSTMKTRSWRCIEVNGFIFVWYHAESIDPEWYIDNIPQISTNEWRCHGRNQFIIQSHIQEIPENGADWAHLNAVHGSGMVANEIFPSLLRHLWSAANWMPKSLLHQSANSHSDHYNTESISKNTEIYHNDQHANNKHRAILNLKHDLVIGGKYSLLHLDVTAEQIGPGYVELHLKSAFGPMCIIQTVTPIQPLVQCVTHIIFSSLIISPYTKIVFLGECIMFDRDIAVWNHKKYQRKPLLVREDRSILAFRRWYSQFYSPSSLTYIDSMKSLDW